MASMRSRVHYSASFERPPSNPHRKGQSLFNSKSLLSQHDDSFPKCCPKLSVMPNFAKMTAFVAEGCTRIGSIRFYILEESLSVQPGPPWLSRLTALVRPLANHTTMFLAWSDTILLRNNKIRLYFNQRRADDLLIPVA